MALETWQWALLALGAFLVGLSKTGIAGLGILFVVLFASVLPARASVGVVLPVLIAADVIAVSAFRRHADWGQLRRLFPWAGAGVVLGFFALGRINDYQTEKLVGGIVLVMVLVHFARQRGQQAKSRAAAQNAEPDILPPASLWFVASMGVLAGFTTMVANAAGPVMIIYLLALRLPKMSFVGTSAWFFLCLNLFKVPFSVRLGLLDVHALRFLLALAPFAVAGAFTGRAVLQRIPQKLFEDLALWLTVAAGLRLLLKGLF